MLTRQGAIESLQLGVTTTTDKSLLALGQIFGPVGDLLPGMSNQTGILQEAMAIVALGVFVVVGIILSYVTVVGVVNTAAQGVAMGHKWGQIKSWMPVRAIGASVALMPQKGGYCFMQILVMWVVVHSVNFANSIWSVFVDHGPITFANVGEISKPPSKDASYYEKLGVSKDNLLVVNKLASAMLKTQLCLQYMRTNECAGQDSASLPTCMNGATQRYKAFKVESTSVPGAGTISYGVDTGNDWPISSTPKELCGSYTYYDGTGQNLLDKLSMASESLVKNKNNNNRLGKFVCSGQTDCELSVDMNDLIKNKYKAYFDVILTQTKELQKKSYSRSKDFIKGEKDTTPKVGWFKIAGYYSYLSGGYFAGLAKAAGDGTGASSTVELPDIGQTQLLPDIERKARLVVAEKDWVGNPGAGDKTKLPGPKVNMEGTIKSWLQDIDNRKLYDLFDLSNYKKEAYNGLGLMKAETPKATASPVDKISTDDEMVDKVIKYTLFNLSGAGDVRGRKAREKISENWGGGPYKATLSDPYDITDPTGTDLAKVTKWTDMVSDNASAAFGKVDQYNLDWYCMHPMMGMAAGLVGKKSCPSSNFFNGPSMAFIFSAGTYAEEGVTYLNPALQRDITMYTWSILNDWKILLSGGDDFTNIKGRSKFGGGSHGNLDLAANDGQGGVKWTLVNPVFRLATFGYSIMKNSMLFWQYATYDTYSYLAKRSSYYYQKMVSYTMITGILQTIGKGLIRGIGYRLMDMKGIPIVGWILALIGLFIVIVGVILIIIGQAMAISAQTLVWWYYLEQAWTMFWYKIATGMAIPPLILGITLLAYIPLVPILIYLFSLLGWIGSVVEAMIAAPLIAYGVAQPQGQDFLSRAEISVMLLMGLFMRPACIVIGFTSGILLSYIGYAFISMMLKPVLVSMMVDISKRSGVGSYFSMLMLMYIYVLIMTTVVKKSYSAIYLLPDMVMRWLGVPVNQSPIESMMKKIEGSSKKSFASVGQGQQGAGGTLGGIGVPR